MDTEPRASLQFSEIVDPDISTRTGLEITAHGTTADLQRLADLLSLAHGTIRCPGIKPIHIVRPTDIVGLTGDGQWNHGRTATPQGTPIS